MACMTPILAGGGRLWLSTWSRFCKLPCIPKKIQFPVCWVLDMQILWLPVILPIYTCACCVSVSTETFNPSISFTCVNVSSVIFWPRCVRDTHLSWDLSFFSDSSIKFCFVYLESYIIRYSGTNFFPKSIPHPFFTRRTPTLLEGEQCT